MIFSEQQIEDALNAAPQAIRDVLEDGTLDTSVAKSCQEQGLHVDQIGAVALHSQNILIGLLKPSEFIFELESSGIPKPVANAILQDLNEQVFKPLNEKIRAEKESGEETPEEPVEPTRTPEKPAPPPPPRIEIAVQEPPPVPVIAPQVQAPVATPPAPTPTPPPVAPMPPAPTPPPTPAPEPPAPPATPQMRTMAHDVEALKDGKMPEPQRPAPPTPQTPAQAPVTHEAAQDMPSHQEVTESLKQYGVDPYREPVE